MTRLSNLFKPAMINRMEVKNRIVMAPMGTFSSDNGFITDRMIDYYRARAEGGVGLIITQVTSVSRKAPGGKEFAALWDDRFIPRLRELADAVHESGAKIATQLGHHGLQHSDPGRLLGYDADEIDVVGPSAVCYLPTNAYCRELSKQDIGELVETFSEAARRTQEAGCDAVEFHGAHGRLINQFLSPFYNKRTDEYGGTAEKRARFACEIISRTREKLGPGFPILIRINGEDDFVGGTTIQEAVRQARCLAEAGADAVDVSCGVQEFAARLIGSWVHPLGLIVHLAEAIKKAVDVPVITVGRLTAAVAERVLREGAADFVAFGRPLLADAELADKAKKGNLKEIRMCLACNNCMHNLTSFLLEGKKIAGRPLRCTVNPALFREKEFVYTPADTAKKVVVIGGGLAGMSAAAVAGKRGHQVSLYEQSDRLGGQWNEAAASEKTKHYHGLTKRLVREMEQSGVAVYLNKPVDADLIADLNPDVIVNAVGAVPGKPDIPGVDGKNVVQAVDVLSGKAASGNKVVVIGGSRYHSQTALFLAEQGKQVSLVTEGLPGEGEEALAFRGIRNILIEKNAAFYFNSKVLNMTEKGVGIYGPMGQIFLTADTIVLATAPRANKEPADELKNKGYDFFSIGDCVEPRSALEAMDEGAETGLKI